MHNYVVKGMSTIGDSDPIIPPPQRSESSQVLAQPLVAPMVKTRVEPLAASLKRETITTLIDTLAPTTDQLARVGRDL